MQKISKKTVIACLHLFVSGGLLFFILSRSMAASNPYNEQGFDLKEGFKNKDILGSRSDKGGPVQLEADQVQFSQENNKAQARGNVVITSSNATMYAEQVELDRAISQAVASGHVYIDSPNMQVDADKATFNFNDSTGEFKNARTFVTPFQIKGETLSRVSEDHMVMENGYMTTCDLDEPHYHLGAKRMDVYPGDKAVARGVTMYLGKTPVMYYPKYVQDLKNPPIFVVTPGYEKDFGMFLLSELRLRLNDHVKVVVHGDLRERTGVGEGVDVKYETPNFGSGIIRSYYAYETQIAGKHIWANKNSDGSKKGDTARHELYRVQWRHKWQVDPNTNVMWQYYKVHDYDLANMGFIKKYFEREYRRGADVTNYFLLTRNLPAGVVSFRIDATRVNRALAGVDRLPEIQYDLSGQRIGETNFYLKTVDTFSNLQNIQPDNHQKTTRFDTNNEISYPKKVAFLEFRPFVGGEHTYYSRTLNENERSVIRGQFRVGSDISTHAYRIWDIRKKILGVEINGLRHVITPTANYLYQHRPTIAANHFNQFDAIDALARSHNVHLALENKLQTKRNEQSVDLIRTIVETDFDLDRKEPGGGFGPVSSIIEFNPNSWLTFRADERYDSRAGHWLDANFDMYINGGDKWSFGIGKRYARDESDQVTTQWIYKINPKWKFKIYHRFYTDSQGLQEEDYMITRDLHEWEVDLDYRQEKGHGQGFYLLFRLKAFPDMGLNLFSNSYHQPKAGS